MSNPLSEFPGFQALLEISSHLASGVDTGALSQSILERAIGVVNAEGGTIYIFNEESQQLEFEFVVSADPTIRDRPQGPEHSSRNGHRGNGGPVSQVRSRDRRRE